MTLVSLLFEQPPFMYVISFQVVEKTVGVTQVKAYPLKRPVVSFQGSSRATNINFMPEKTVQLERRIDTLLLIIGEGKKIKT